MTDKNKETEVKDNPIKKIKDKAKDFADTFLGILRQQELHLNRIHRLEKTIGELGETVGKLEARIEMIEGSS